LATLSEARKSGWRRFVDAARRTPVAATLPAQEPRTDEELAPARTAARTAVERALQQTEAELKAAQSVVPATDDGGWRRLEEAVRKLEADLRTPGTLRQRLDEGRRSMLPKVERLVHSRLTPVVRQKGRRLVATVDEEGLAALRTELPEWVEGWSHYVLSWLELDLSRETEIAWARRDGELPVRPPTFRPLAMPATQSALEFPDVSLARDVGGLAGGVMRNARSIAYGLLSLTFLFGVAKSSIPWWMYGVGFLAAVAVGAVMASEERGADRKRLEAEVRQKAEQATWEATRQWLDRMADKLAEHIRSELHARRGELLLWWQREVRPKAEAAEREVTAGKAKLDEARLAIPRLQETKRALAAAVQALDAIPEG
jgi:hypothetical protein